MLRRRHGGLGDGNFAGPIGSKFLNGSEVCMFRLGRHFMLGPNIAALGILAVRPGLDLVSRDIDLAHGRAWASLPAMHLHPSFMGRAGLGFSENRRHGWKGTASSFHSYAPEGDKTSATWAASTARRYHHATIWPI